jgi:hypothetical protein
MRDDGDRLTDDDLAAIEARVNAATPGPWEAEGSLVWGPEQSTRGGWGAMRTESDGEGRAPLGDFNDGEYTASLRAEQDATFTAHAREDVPALLAEVRRLREIEQAARDYCVAAERTQQHVRLAALGTAWQEERLRLVECEYTAYEALREMVGVAEWRASIQEGE